MQTGYNRVIALFAQMTSPLLICEVPHGLEIFHYTLLFTLGTFQVQAASVTGQLFMPHLQPVIQFGTYKPLCNVFGGTRKPYTLDRECRKPVRVTPTSLSKWDHKISDFVFLQVVQCLSLTDLFTTCICVQMVYFINGFDVFP